MKITNCRICNSAHISKVISLGYHPLADTFLPENLLYGPEVSYPLELASCQACGHVFTLYSVSAVDRYQKQDYSYDSSNSSVSILHFEEFANAVLSSVKLELDALIVDIGSNVGTLLSSFQNLGYNNVLGVEPSKNISALALSYGVPTLNEFFGDEVIPALKQYGPIKILLSANVLNHADSLADFLHTARNLLDSDGVFVFEVPYLMDLIKSTAFDTIYHEHVHYYGIKPLAMCLQSHGFSIYKVERLDYMCGSIRVYTRVGGNHSAMVEEMIVEEEVFGLYNLSTYHQFMDRVKKVKMMVNADLAKILNDGGKIVGIGAATKGNTFLNYCNLDSDTISYIADASLLKVGKLTPGSHIPIVSDQDIDRLATHAVILPWNIAPMLEKKLAHLGLKFYVPRVQTLEDHT